MVLLVHLPALNKIVGSVNNTSFVFGEKDTTPSMVLKLVLNFQSLEDLNSGTVDPIHSTCIEVERNLDVLSKENENEDEAIEKEEEDDEGKHCTMFEMTHL